MTQREEFEAWIKTSKGHPFAGQFANLMWGAWQAAGALEAQAVEIKRLVVIQNSIAEANWGLHEKIAAQRKELAAIRAQPVQPSQSRDAERYQWLKSNCVVQNRATSDGPAYKQLTFCGNMYSDWRFGIDHIGLDAAIDAAINAKGVV